MGAEKPRPNLSDVARQVGVSPTTVSRVLHQTASVSLHVPEDVSVIGIDSVHMAAYAIPPLTNLAPPKHRMGRMFMQILERMIAGQRPPEPGYTLVEAPLIVRESTGPAPSSNGRSLVAEIANAQRKG